MLDENTMKRILETKQALVNTYYIIESTISGLSSLEGENVVLKKGMEALKLSVTVEEINMLSGGFLLGLGSKANEFESFSFTLSCMVARWRCQLQVQWMRKDRLSELASLKVYCF